MLENIKKLKSFTFEGYWIVFDPELKNHPFDEGYCYGIKFWQNDICYDLIHNRVGWTRIIISSKEGHIKDIPFNENTIDLLPKGIVFRKIPDTWSPNE